MSQRRVIVIGGGAIGTACAYYLRRSGWTVTLVDRDRQGQGCSSGNCGRMCNAHVLPLNYPGAVGQTLRALCRPDSPLYVKLRLDPGLWWWMLQFARRCNETAMFESARARAALLDSSAALYRRLLADESIDCEWQDRGCLYVYGTRAGMEGYAGTERILQEQFGLTATRYDGDALVEFEPALKRGLAGGWHHACDSDLRPEKLMIAWRGVLERMGVTILEERSVHGFDRESGRAVAVRTDRGPLPADAAVVATGALAPFLAGELGCRIPIQPGKGYSMTMRHPATCPKVPIIFQEHKVMVTPMRSGYRLGSTMEFSGYDTSLSQRRLELLKRGAAHYLREPYTEPIEEEWFGWRPMTYDGKPIIDRSPRMENVYIAAGHNMLGLTLAPVTGKLIAEMLDGRPPHLDVTPFSVNRF